MKKTAPSEPRTTPKPPKQRHGGNGAAKHRTAEQRAPTIPSSKSDGRIAVAETPPARPLRIEETTNRFTFAAFSEALSSTNPSVSPSKIRNLLVREFWLDDFDQPGPQDGNTTEAWMAHGVTSHPSGEAGFSAQSTPLMRVDVMTELLTVQGCPPNPVIDSIMKTATTRECLKGAGLFQDLMPPVVRDIARHLAEAEWEAYPPVGQLLLGRIILPYRRLVAFCERHDLQMPDYLRHRAGLPVDDGSIAPASTKRGRPAKHTELYLEQFKRRVAAGTVHSSAMAEARDLRDWLAEHLKEAGDSAAPGALPTDETIRNTLLRHYDFRNMGWKENQD